MGFGWSEIVRARATPSGPEKTPFEIKEVKAQPDGFGAELHGSRLIRRQRRIPRAM